MAGEQHSSLPFCGVRSGGRQSRIMQGRECEDTGPAGAPAVAPHFSWSRFPPSPAHSESLLSPCPLHFMSLHPPMLPQSLLHVVAPSELVSPVHSSLWASGGLTQVGVQGPSLPWSCRLYLRPQVPPSLDAAPLPHSYC